MAKYEIIYQKTVKEETLYNAGCLVRQMEPLRQFYAQWCLDCETMLQANGKCTFTFGSISQKNVGTWSYSSASYDTVYCDQKSRSCTACIQDIHKVKNQLPLIFTIHQM